MSQNSESLWTDCRPQFIVWTLLSLYLEPSTSVWLKPNKLNEAWEIFAAGDD